MILEFRNKEGILFGKMSGVSAQKQYGHIVDSGNFVATRKKLKLSSETEYTDHLVFLCNVCCVMYYGELEIWFDKDDYIKII